MLKIIGLVVGLAILVVLILAAVKPDEFRVERRLTMQASPEAIFVLIDDFHRWSQWSPYEKKDPAMQRTFSGADSGKGAVYAWNGNQDIGSGRMEIIDSTSPSHIVIRLDFFKPMVATNMAEFTLQAHDGGTEVIWAMYGKASFISKLMQVFFDMDRMVGTDFEAGLAALKNAAEA